jgi:hypothetical protein
LAHISAGFSAGSIKKTVKTVMTKHRIQNIPKRPLTIAEFVGPLTLCSATMDDQYEDFKVSILTFNSTILDFHRYHYRRQSKERETQPRWWRRRHWKEEKEEERIVTL